MCFKCCFPVTKLKGIVGRRGSVKVSTPVIEFHPISEKEQLFAKKLRWIPSLSNSNKSKNNGISDQENNNNNENKNNRVAISNSNIILDYSTPPVTQKSKPNENENNNEKPSRYALSKPYLHCLHVLPCWNVVLYRIIILCPSTTFHLRKEMTAIYLLSIAWLCSYDYSPGEKKIYLFSLD